MLIDNTNDKNTSEAEEQIRSTLVSYGMNPMLVPDCTDDIIKLVNKLHKEAATAKPESKPKRPRPSLPDPPKATTVYRPILPTPSKYIK